MGRGLATTAHPEMLTLRSYGLGTDAAYHALTFLLMLGRCPGLHAGRAQAASDLHPGDSVRLFC